MFKDFISILTSALSVVIPLITLFLGREDSFLNIFIDPILFEELTVLSLLFSFLASLFIIRRPYFKFVTSKKTEQIFQEYSYRTNRSDFKIEEISKYKRDNAAPRSPRYFDQHSLAVVILFIFIFCSFPFILLGFLGDPSICYIIVQSLAYVFSLVSFSYVLAYYLYSFYSRDKYESLRKKRARTAFQLARSHNAFSEPQPSFKNIDDRGVEYRVEVELDGKTYNIYTNYSITEFRGCVPQEDK